MIEEEHPLGAVSGHDDLARLPNKERARMRRLRDWLAVPTWTPSQAVAILCGYDPELGGNRAADVSFLPGAHDFYGVPFGAREPDDLWELDFGLEGQRDYIRGLRLTTMPPTKAIAKTVAARVSIPWFDAARADPWCRKYLPPEVLDVSDDAPNVPLTAREVASLGGRAKRDNDPKRQRFFPIVRALHESGIITAEIVRRLFDDFGDEPDENLPSGGTVYRWVRDIEAAKKAQESGD